MDTNDNSSLSKTNQMIDEDIFWKIIDDSIQKTTNQDDQEQYLIKSLLLLSPQEIIGFRLRTDKLLYDSYRSELWCAAYIMNGGCSDDGFEYFRNWLISRGKNVFYTAIKIPDSLINEITVSTDYYEFESFWYVALEAFQIKTNKDLYDYIDYDTFTTREFNYPDIQFNWSEDRIDSMKILCPQLFEKLWNK